MDIYTYIYFLKILIVLQLFYYQIFITNLFITKFIYYYLLPIYYNYFIIILLPKYKNISVVSVT